MKETSFAGLWMISPPSWTSISGALDVPLVGAEEEEHEVVLAGAQRVSNQYWRGYVCIWVQNLGQRWNENAPTFHIAFIDNCAFEVHLLSEG